MKLTNANKISGELATRNMSEKAYKAYSGSDYTVCEHNGTYSVFLDSEEVVSEVSFEELNDFFESEVDG